MEHALTTNNLSVSVGEKTILYPTTISIEMGEMTAIIGANGAGKSTFMRAALGLIPHSGFSSLSSKTINERMKFASWVSQDRELVWDVRVKTLLQFTLERTLRTIDTSFQKKLTGINEALELTNISQLADQQVNSLSGGEVTAVLIARTLVQQTPIIFLDEPLASLDPIQKIKILSKRSFGGHRDGKCYCGKFALHGCSLKASKKLGQLGHGPKQRSNEQDDETCFHR